MVMTKQAGASRKGLLTWLLPGVLGLLALSAGALVPRSLPEGEHGRAGEMAPGKTPAALPVAGKVDGPGASTAASKEELDYNPPALPDLPSPQAMMLRLGLGTVFVLLLCCVTLWCGKRWLRAYALPEVANKQMQVLEVLPLGGRCSVLLLQAGRCRVLAGMDASGLKSLVPLPESFESTLADLGETNSDEGRPLSMPTAAPGRG